MMRSRKITFKIVLSYVLLLLLSIVVVFMIYIETQRLIEAEKSIQFDRNRIMKMNKILILMNQAESAGKIAIRTDDESALKYFLDKNCVLQDSIIAFKKNVASEKHLQKLDTVQYLLDLKSENLQELKALQSADSSAIIIRNAIEKLSSLESSLGYYVLDDRNNFKKNKKQPTKNQIVTSDEQASSLVNKYKDIKIPPTRSLGTLDKTVLETLALLNKVNAENAKYKSEQKEKIQKLWHNDNLFSERLNSLLSDFEQDILKSSQKILDERSVAFQRSKLILMISCIIAIIIVIISSFMIVRDFWRIQEFRRELENANIKTQQLLKNREQLISMVSHDLRTPLSSIIGYSQLLHNESVSQKTSNYVSHIKYASEYIQNLLDELLDYSKIEAGKVQIQKVPFNLHQIIQEVAENVYSIYKDRPVSLHVNTDKFLKETHFSNDVHRIKQVLYNLISNAFKFTEKGSVTIKSTYEVIDNEVFSISIDVIDTGIGIKNEEQFHIFDEFMQANDNISKKYGGTGLGLNISQKLAQLLKGKIKVKSKEGEGSTFTFEFLTQKVSKNEKNDSQEVICTKKCEEITIIVIDDDLSVLRLIEELLLRKGIQVKTFTHAKKVLSQLDLLDFDMIITDIQLPEMNGFHFVKLLKNSYKKDQIPPILAITGRKDIIESHYTENGFAGILRKPFTPFQFYEKLHYFFQNVDYQEDTSEEKTHSDVANYQPESLELFMGNDPEGITAVLQDFFAETLKNIDLLKSAAQNNDYTPIKSVSHKMLSMFGQLNAQRETAILLFLETAENQEVSVLKEKITALEKLFLEECKPYIERYIKRLSD